MTEAAELVSASLIHPGVLESKVHAVFFYKTRKFPSKSD